MWMAHYMLSLTTFWGLSLPSLGKVVDDQLIAISFDASRSDDLEENFVQITPQSELRSLDIGICFRMSLRYSIPNSLLSDDRIIIDLASPSKGYGYIALGGVMTVFDLNDTVIKPTQWNNFCASSDKTSNPDEDHFKLYMNGIKYLDEHKATENNTVVVKGDLTVGKRKGSSFTRSPSFHGLIADFVMLGRQLTDEEMVGFTKEFQPLDETGIRAVVVLALMTVNYYIYNFVLIDIWIKPIDFVSGSRGSLTSQVRLSRAEIKSPTNIGRKYTLLRKLNNYKRSSLICQQLGGSLKTGRGNATMIKNHLEGEHHE